MDLSEAQARGFDSASRHPWETARVDVVRRLLRGRASLAAGAVLDIGCGDTFVVERLAADFRDTTFYAVDTAFTDDLVDRYKRQLNNPRIRLFPSLESIEPPLARPASLVLLMDVIEHIERDRAFLADVCRRPFVGPETQFLVTVPAYQALFCSHDSFLGHYRRYSNRTLRSCLEDSGLRVVDIGYFFASLLPIRLLQVFKERVIGSRPVQETTGLVSWQGGNAAAALLRSVLSLDARMAMLLKTMGITVPGLSNYALCVKSA